MNSQPYSYQHNDKMGMYQPQPSIYAANSVMKMPNQYMQNPQAPMQMGYMNSYPQNSNLPRYLSVSPDELLLPDARIPPRGQYDDAPQRQTNVHARAAAHA